MKRWENYEEMETLWHGYENLMFDDAMVASRFIKCTRTAVTSSLNVLARSRIITGFAGLVVGASALQSEGYGIKLRPGNTEGLKFRDGFI